MARKIIIDTDPGQDDAVAILLALASPELDILGITAVAGNGRWRAPRSMRARSAKWRKAGNKGVRRLHSPSGAPARDG